MISLNLLSPQQKEALRMRVYCALVSRLAAAGIMLAILLTAALVAVKIGLTRQLQTAQGRQLLSNEYGTANQDTLAINAATSRIGKLQDASVALSPIMHDLLGRVPDGVQLSVISIDARSRAFSVSGLAATRDQLLRFEESLRGSPYLAKLDNPLNNLFQKNDVRFTMTATLTSKP